MNKTNYFELKDVINITKSDENGVLGNMLHPTYPIKYASVLGKSKSLDKTINYANNRYVTPHYLTHNYSRKPPNSEDRYEPEHDGLLFLTLERIFAEEELVCMLIDNAYLKTVSYTPLLTASKNGVDMIRVNNFLYEEYQTVVEEILELFSSWSELDDPELTLSYAFDKLSHADDMCVRFPARSLVLRFPL